MLYFYVVASWTLITNRVGIGTVSSGGGQSASQNTAVTIV